MNTHRLRVLSVLAAMLAAAGCTRTMSLGAAGMPDGGDATVMTSNDARDAPVDLNTDGPTVTCVDQGVTYHVGEVIPRGVNGCLMSCICRPDGTVGFCTGVACPTDGLMGAVVEAQITLTRSTNTPEFRVTVDSLGNAARAVVDLTGTPQNLRSFPVGSPEGTLFLYEIYRRSAISAPSAIPARSSGSRAESRSRSALRPRSPRSASAAATCNAWSIQRPRKPRWRATPTCCSPSTRATTSRMRESACRPGAFRRPAFAARAAATSPIPAGSAPVLAHPPRATPSTPAYAPMVVAS